ncbi:MAG: hypoxanthine phosphoribosyltransferase [Methylacidiphilales bacterium]|nr:hypoxanthine phosphoribosyltransferase [Candidatus Methylacidiphilales bacterium]
MKRRHLRRVVDIDVDKGGKFQKKWAMPPGRVLLTQKQIRARVRQLGRAISRRYRGRRVCFLGVMNGALFFLADLLRAVELVDTEICCVRLASYAGTRSTGRLRGLDTVGDSFHGRCVIIVDDILDTGRTLSALVRRVKKLGAAEVKICVLLEKRRKRECPFRADWIGFRVKDEFVVGYGLDYDGRYRGLKQVRVLKTTVTLRHKK